MFEDFDTTGCLRVEIVRTGFVRARQVTFVTLRAFYSGKPSQEVTVDLDVDGINPESLELLVRALNATLRARHAEATESPGQE